MRTLLRQFARDDSGATAIEYALVATLIAVAVIGSVSTIGTKLKAKFGQISGNLT